MVLIPPARSRSLNIAVPSPITGVKSSINQLYDEDSAAGPHAALLASVSAQLQGVHLLMAELAGLVEGLQGANADQVRVGL